MHCPTCGVETIIGAARTEVVGDDSPSTQTEVFEVLSHFCRNTLCPNTGKKVVEQKIKIYPNEGDEKHE